MKSIKSTALLILFCFFCSSQVGAKKIISKSDAWNIVKQELALDSNTNVEVSEFISLIKANDTIQLLSSKLKAPTYDSWGFFIDDKPRANWGHPCRYVFVNCQTGSLTAINSFMPPIDDSLKLITPRPKSMGQGIVNLADLRAKSLKANTDNSSTVRNHDYAVIISGGGNKEYNYVRYWNDCSAIYSTLINTYSYQKDHIFVLIADGTSPDKDRHLLDMSYDSSPLDLDGDGLPDIQYSATKENISKVFSQLGNTLSSKDNLFIYVTDHGDLVSSETKSSNIILWNNTSMTDAEFSNEVNKVQAGKINVCMEQCYSGGFIDDLSGNNRLIVTACAYNEVSYGTRDNLYDEFVYHWTAAVFGAYPSGVPVDADTNRDGKISMTEAFVYARDHDTMDEHPQCSFGLQPIGDCTYLAQDDNWSIQGEDYVYDSATYYIKDLPKGYSVKWNLSNSNQSTSPVYIGTPLLSDSCIVVNNVFYPCQRTLSALILKDAEVIDSISKEIFTLAAYNGTYQQESCFYYGVTHPKIQPKALKEGSAYFVHQGCTVLLSSTLFKHCFIDSYNGIVPDYLNQLDNGNITFSLPLGSGGIPFNLYIYPKGSKKKLHFLFFTVSNNGNLSSSPRLSIKSTENSLSISILNDKNTSESWNVEVYNVTTGEKAEESDMGTGVLQLKTDKWEKGLYVVRATSGSNVLSEKVYLK